MGVEALYEEMGESAMIFLVAGGSSRLWIRGACSTGETSALARSRSTRTASVMRIDPDGDPAGGDGRLMMALIVAWPVLPANFVGSPGSGGSGIPDPPAGVLGAGWMGSYTR